MAAEVEVQVGSRTVRVTNPDRVYFPARGETKLDLVHYYLSVGDGIVRALRDRPCMMHRFPSGVAEDVAGGGKVHQKRVPHGAPPWLETVRVDFPRYRRHAYELCVTELASVVWAVQMSTVEFHPWNSRRADTERPDEWRIDLDPMHAASSARCAGSPASCARYSANWARWAGPRPPAATACTSTCGSSPGGVSPTSAGPRRPSPGRSSAALRATSPPPGGARTGTRPSFSSTTTRTPGTTRSRAPTRCAGCRRRPCRPRSPGTRSTTSTRARSRLPPCPAASRNSATFTRASTTPPTHCTPCCSGPTATASTNPPTMAATPPREGRHGSPALRATYQHLRWKDPRQALRKRSDPECCADKLPSSCLAPRSSHRSSGGRFAMPWPVKACTPSS